MAPIGKLYAPTSTSFRTKRALAVAAYTGQEVERPAFTFGETNKSAEFLAKFPAGKIPAFEGADGFNLTEGAAIAAYFAALAPNSGLMSTDAQTNAKIAQWISFAEFEIAARLDLATGMFNNYVPFVKPVYTNRMEHVFKAMDVLEAYLASNTYLVGDRITLADITLASVLADAFSKFFGPEEQKKYTNSLRFEQTIVNNPKIASAFEGVSLATTAAVYTPPKKEAAPKAAKEATPKADKPKAAPKPKDDDEDDEPSHADAPPAKNPLDELPKSSMNLIDLKVKYSNTDTLKEFVPWFYENFDKDGYSVWKVDFKYNDELTLPFMSANQIGGFFARLEGARKYLFGSVGVLGKANDSIITGIFVARGQDIAAVASFAPDWESYSYTPLDMTKEEDKKFFEGACAWELTVDGKEWADGKNFK